MKGGRSLYMLPCPACGVWPRAFCLKASALRPDCIRAHQLYKPLGGADESWMAGLMAFLSVEVSPSLFGVTVHTRKSNV